MRAVPPAARRSVWALACGVAALALAIHGQRLLTLRRDLAGGTLWYALGIALLLAGWARTYRNLGLACEPAVSFGAEAPGRARRRASLAAAAVALNLLGVWLLHSHAYASWPGGLGWLASLVLLFLALRNARGPAAEGFRDSAGDAETGLRLSRGAERALLGGIVLLAVALRAYRLGDWTTGMHGDEGEVGAEALSILEGGRPSPFEVGWFAQSNVYYWCVALTMKAFGTGLAGLRLFALVAGVLTVPALYLLVRRWFGVRAALLAGVLLAISDVAIHFGRQQFSNITLPLCLVLGGHFLFRGLGRGRLGDLVLAGYAHGLGLYFYVGGRLGPLVLLAFAAYALLPPPGLAGGWRAQAAAARRRLGPLAVCLLAALCMATPWLAYYADHRELWDARVAEKLVFHNAERVAAASGAGHEPLLALGVTLVRDGFWPRALWSQLLATLSILTWRPDGSSVFTFTQEPIAKPLEAPLIVLGIAWALWRWRDVRMALPSLWFWSSVLVGGVLTIDAPYMARLVGILPALAVFAALVLDGLAASLVRAAAPGAKRAALGLGSATLGTLLAFLAWQGASDYFQRYVGPWAFREATGQAVFVRDARREAARRGRPDPTFYHLAVPLLYWDYGVNRFLNHGARGRDVANVAASLPLLDEDAGDAVFMVWGVDAQDLPVLRAYYPGGELRPFFYGPQDARDPLFVSYRVAREEIRALRVARASYTGASGGVVRREEPGLGTLQPPPASLGYPASARWATGLYSPRFALRRFRVQGPGGAVLRVDGVAVAVVGPEGAAEGRALLALGLHAVELSGPLASASSRILVEWAGAEGSWGPLPRRLLWPGPGRGLSGEVRSLGPDPFGPWPEAGPRFLRVDGALAFRDTARELGGGEPLQARWTGSLRVEAAGRQRFWLSSNGGSTLSVDGRLVVDDREASGAPGEAAGELELAPGPHRLEVRYAWREGPGLLEAFWQPPGGPRTILGPLGLEAEAGLPDPATRPAAQPQPEPAPVAGVVLETALRGPHGLAVGPGGLLYGTDGAGARVLVLDGGGRELRSWGRRGKGAGELEDPEDIAVDPEGRVFVLDHGRSDVQVFDARGRLQRRIGDGTWCSPAGFGLAPDHRLYVAETCGSRVLQYSPDGVLERALSAGPDAAERLDQPVDVAVDAKGAVFVADLRDRVVEIDPRSDRIRRRWPVHVGRAGGAANLALSGKGLFLTDPDSGRLVRIDTASGSVDVLTGLAVRPLALATGPGGELYLADLADGRIQALPAQGLPGP